VRIARGNVTKYGLPKPDHRILCAPPTVSDSLLSRLDHGDIVVKPSIERFDRGRVYFTDGSAEQVGTVIYCTGYKISFPFLDKAVIGADDNPIPLYHRVVPPRLPGLYFIGLVQPIGATMPIAESQSEWVADLLQGRAILPAEPQMKRKIARYRAATAKRYARFGMASRAGSRHGRDQSARRQVMRYAGCAYPVRVAGKSEGGRGHRAIPGAVPMARS
jgi:dimethylaniline monooxygenase (N-oxide forming)